MCIHRISKIRQLISLFMELLSNPNILITRQGTFAHFRCLCSPSIHPCRIGRPGHKRSWYGLLGYRSYSFELWEQMGIARIAGHRRCSRGWRLRRFSLYEIWSISPSRTCGASNRWWLGISFDSRQLCFDWSLEMRTSFVNSFLYNICVATEANYVLLIKWCQRFLNLFFRNRFFLRWHAKSHNFVKTQIFLALSA